MLCTLSPVLIVAHPPSSVSISLCPSAPLSLHQSASVSTLSSLCLQVALRLVHRFAFSAEKKRMAMVATVESKGTAHHAMFLKGQRLHRTILAPTLHHPCTHTASSLHSHCTLLVPTLHLVCTYTAPCLHLHCTLLGVQLHGRLRPRLCPLLSNHSIPSSLSPNRLTLPHSQVPLRWCGRAWQRCLPPLTTSTTGWRGTGTGCWPWPSAG